jgi:hypothetical protein
LDIVGRRDPKRVRFFVRSRALDAADATEDDDGGTKVDRAFAIIILISLARAGGLDFFFFILDN